jgi:hypothetical protein
MLTAKRRLDLVVSTSAKLFGEAWQSTLARGLGAFHPRGRRRSIDRRLVRRWIAGERPVPEWVVPALARIAKSRATEVNTIASRLERAGATGC